MTAFDETKLLQATDSDLEAAPAPVFRMIGKSGGLCLDDSCSIEQYLDTEPA